ncbi:Golgi transport complex subunit 5-domain-containing protein [Hysterangium stoloniferum]|nr:Golgi transport complex subunit 5-domain-containing protein [Hysterangium stoloniferum]
MADYDVFLRPDFDPNDYANAILAGEPYPPPSSRLHTQKTRSTTTDLPKEDISLVLTKLNLGIDDVAKQLKTVVTNHHETLLIQASGAADLQESVTAVRKGLTEITQSLEKLRQKIRIPYQALESQVSRLQRLQLAADVLRRTARFVIVARRLEFQMSEFNKAKEEKTPNADIKSSNGANGEHEGEKERNLAKAALSIAELTSLLEDAPPPPPSPTESHVDPEDPLASDVKPIPLRSVNAAMSYVPAIDAAHKQVTAEMESMVMSGLANVNQSLLASSLQTAYNLRRLPELVQSLITDLNETVQSRIQLAFDISGISKETNAKDSSMSSSLIYKSRIRMEPTNLTAPQWTTTLWSRLETLIEDLSSCCIKVYALEKVLNMKKDAVSQTYFLDEAMKANNKPSTIFWTTLSRSLDKHSREAAKSSTFLQQTLGTGYPRLLRLFHDFFAKISVHTDTAYSQTHQSPETILVLRAISQLESFYLSRSLNRLNDSVGQAMSGGARAPPGAAEGMAIARTIANELDSAKFDPLLVNGVAKNVNTCLEGFIGRVDTMIVRERSATSMLGPTASQQLALNAQLVVAVHNCQSRLRKLQEEHSATVFSAFEEAIRNIQRTCERTYNPLLVAIRREIGSIIARLHRVDFGKTLDNILPGMGGASAYMKELVEKLSFVRKEVLNRYNIGEITQEWTISIVKYTLRTFVNHVSIVKPLGESGKLQLTSDMAELEFALNAFMSEQGQNATKLDVIGDDYRALRGLRPLLFLDNALLASPEATVGLPPLVVLHHILVRSPIPLPHSLHGWHEAEYVRWVDEHSEEESWTLIDGGLVHWEKVHEGEGSKQGAEEYVQLAKTVLQQAKRARVA